MEHKRQRMLLRLFIKIGLCLSFLLLFTSRMSVIAGESPYKSAEPKIDTANPMPKEAPPRTKAPLVGNIQHNEAPGSHRGRLMFGGKKGSLDGQGMKARVTEDNNALKSQVESSIGIIGVKFVATAGRAPVINEVFPGTPADQVGLRLYDMIVAVDGIPTAGLTKDEVFDLIVGTPGTKVTLSIMRNGDYYAVSCTRMDINTLIDPRIRRDYLIHM